MSKYRNIPITIQGFHFDSKAEGRRFQELQLLERAGQIHNLKIHPCYVVWEHYDVTRFRNDTIIYEADFSYIEGGEIVVEDVKGVETDVYRLKKKMFLAKYPEIRFMEIKA